MKSGTPASAFSRFLLVTGLILGLFTSSVVLAKPSDKERWDSKYETEKFLFGTEPISFLRNNIHMLPKGKVLDIAMGEGRNGVYLATQGFDVEGIDISEVGLNKAHKLAAHHNVKITTRVVDLENAHLPKDTYDVVLCTYYMQRSLVPEMKAAVKPGGVVVVETYNEHYLKYSNFRPEWVLKTNELLDWFRDFEILRYETFDDGKNAYSSIIARRP